MVRTHGIDGIIASRYSLLEIALEAVKAELVSTIWHFDNFISLIVAVTA